MHKHYLSELLDYVYNSQDAIVVSVKWTFAWVIVSIPSFIPDAQDYIKFISVILGLITGVGGVIATWIKVLKLAKEEHPMLHKILTLGLSKKKKQ